jgi:GDP-D-mannose dehydratase
MMWIILQYDKAEDWIIATVVMTRIREFVRMAFSVADIKVEFKEKIKKKKHMLYIVKTRNIS